MNSIIFDSITTNDAGPYACGTDMFTIEVLGKLAGHYACGTDMFTIEVLGDKEHYGFTTVGHCGPLYTIVWLHTSCPI